MQSGVFKAVRGEEPADSPYWFEDVKKVLQTVG